MEGLTEGRIVHFVLVDRHGEQVHRPAIVVRVWNKENGSVNLQVFTDGSNDGEVYKSGIWWGTSVSHSEEPEPYTWHWPERA